MHLRPGDPIRIDIPVVRVRGTVTLGEKPIGARVTFGGASGTSPFR